MKHHTPDARQMEMFGDTPLMKQAASLMRDMKALQGRIESVDASKWLQFSNELESIRRRLIAMGALGSNSYRNSKWDAPMYLGGEVNGNYTEFFVGSFDFYLQDILAHMADGSAKSGEEAWEMHRLELRTISDRERARLENALRQTEDPSVRIDEPEDENARVWHKHRHFRPQLNAAEERRIRKLLTEKPEEPAA